MNVKKSTIVRLILLLIGIFFALTGLASGFSRGQIYLGLSYANSFSGFVIGTIGVLLAIAESGQLYHQYQQTKRNIADKQSKK